MALIKCTNCGQSISDKALKCPKCGSPIQKEEKTEDQPVQVQPHQMEPTEPLHSEQKSEKPQSKKAIIAVCGVLIALLVIGGGIFLYNINAIDTSNNNEKPLYSVELVERAENGEAVAQFILGVCYANGDGVSQDYNEAVKWYRKSAEQGNSAGQLYLGLCYLDGNGVSRDYNEAVRWFRKSAEQEFADGQYALGLCYLDGKGVSQNYDEAVKWFRKAAEQDYTPAIEMLRDIEAKSTSEEFSIVGKVYKGTGNGGGIYTEMSISFFADNKCLGVSDWYQAFSEPKTVECTYEKNEGKVIIYYKYDDISDKFVFDISENGRVLGFNNSDENVEGTMGYDFMTLELEE